MAPEQSSLTSIAASLKRANALAAYKELYEMGMFKNDEDYVNLLVGILRNEGYNPDYIRKNYLKGDD